LVNNLGSVEACRRRGMKVRMERWAIEANEVAPEWLEMIGPTQRVCGRGTAVGLRYLVRGARVVSASGAPTEGGALRLHSDRS
jgi:hypothetical protein